MVGRDGMLTQQHKLELCKPRGAGTAAWLDSRGHGGGAAERCEIACGRATGRGCLAEAMGGMGEEGWGWGGWICGRSEVLMLGWWWSCRPWTRSMRLGRVACARFGIVIPPCLPQLQLPHVHNQTPLAQPPTPLHTTAPPIFQLLSIPAKPVPRTPPAFPDSCLRRCARRPWPPSFLSATLMSTPRLRITPSPRHPRPRPLRSSSTGPRAIFASTMASYSAASAFPALLACWA